MEGQGGYMMLPIFGSVRNTVKMAEMDSKWQQKKANGGKAVQKEMDPQLKQIQQYKEDLQKMRESNQMASIDAKLSSGGLLTPEEISYLQKNSPEKYREYMEIRNEREAYERQVRSCRTKDEVERLKLSKMNGFIAEAKSITNNPNIPKGQKRGMLEKILRKVMGIQKEHLKFVRSAQYKNLPTDEELAEEIKKKAGQSKEFAEDIGDNAAEDTKQEENMEEISETDDVIDDLGETDAKSIENKADKIKDALEVEEHKTYTLPELRQAADAAFQKAEIELKGHLKAYRS